MAATSQNNIWEKTELALVRYILTLPVGLNESNLYPGHANAGNESPRIVAECHGGEVETRGRATGVWIVQTTTAIITKLMDETGEDNSGRFAVIMDGYSIRGLPAALSYDREFFTCFQHQITGFAKRIEGDRLVSEITMDLTCCGSVII